MGSWKTWFVDSEGWKDISEDFESLTGTVDEMAKEIGAYVLPIKHDCFDVYMVQPRFIEQRIKDDFAAIQAMNHHTPEYDAAMNTFLFSLPTDSKEFVDRWWHYQFGSLIRQFRYVIFFSLGEDPEDGYALDGHTIYCEDIKQMLDVVSLLKTVLTTNPSML